MSELDEYLKEVCACGDTRGWHFPPLPSNVSLKIVQERGPGECRRGTCKCRGFVPMIRAATS
jgi:hypothetical protein